MDVSRHQCLIYPGAGPGPLAALVAEIRERLRQNYRCLYFNTEPMIARLRFLLATAGVDVAYELATSSLVLSSEQKHLDESGSFDVDRMIQGMSDALDRALGAGYDGLWASGDMAWEFGPKKDFSKLLAYEWQAEELVCQRPELIGVCQYRADTLPREAMLRGLQAHPALFINESLTMSNPYYRRPEVFTEDPEKHPEVEIALDRIYRVARSN